ncbi:hypothetical protein LTR85_010198 [Meristemomyces frigidus]|nr:hypothetical protein LTR85_010198 [Meristemomyces frigidus]
MSSSEAQSHTAAAPSLESDGERGGGSSDTDSAIGSWRSTRTQSLTSSTVDFKFENGRRYHAFREGEYYLPNDESEQDRLDLQHAVFRYALDGRLFLAPLLKDNLHDVLDVGCGTGLWAMDVADENPQAQVLGFDLRVPPNCKFLVDDVNSDWVFAEKYNLIHSRAMTPGVRDWSRYFRQAYDQLKPGGYIEFHEVSVPAVCTEAASNPTPYLVQWSAGAAEAGHVSGLDFTAPKKLEGLLQATGFTNIKVQWQNWPVGTWAKGAKNKHIGRWWAEDLKTGVRSTAALFTRVHGWTVEEFEVFAAKVVNEIDSQEKHVWFEV